MNILDTDIQKFFDEYHQCPHCKNHIKINAIIQPLLYQDTNHLLFKNITKVKVEPLKLKGVK